MVVLVDVLVDVLVEVDVWVVDVVVVVVVSGTDVAAIKSISVQQSFNPE